MGQDRQQQIRYKRSRFSTRLPVDRRYTASHFWAVEQQAGLWRVGMTKFATRMLGDLVEFEFDAKPGQQVSVGQTIGWIEAFKALTDLYCVVDGVFRGVNPLIEAGYQPGRFRSLRQGLALQRQRQPRIQERGRARIRGDSGPQHRQDERTGGRQGQSWIRPATS